MLIMAGVNSWHPIYLIGKDYVSESSARLRGLKDEQLEAARVELGDGVLTAYEVSGMHLQGTELVTLTAGGPSSGEVNPNPAIGLREGFLLAGARSLTMSMWEVPPEETAAQVRDFYRRWLSSDNQSPLSYRYQAFHEAQD